MRSRQSKLASVARMGVLVLMLSATGLMQTGCCIAYPGFWQTWELMKGGPGRMNSGNIKSEDGKLGDIVGWQPTQRPDPGLNDSWNDVDRNSGMPQRTGPGVLDIDDEPTGPGPQGCAIVRDTSGVAQRMAVRDGEPTWEVVEEGDQLGPLCVVRTGLDSKLALLLPGGSRVDLGSATKMGIAGLGEDGGPSQITLKYGSLSLGNDNPPAGSPVNVDTPGGALRFVGPRGRVSYGGTSGLALIGAGAWYGGAPRDPRDLQMSTPGNQPDTRTVDTTASASRDRAMAAAIPRLPHPTKMLTPAWTPTYRPPGTAAASATPQVTPVTMRRVITARATPVTTVPDLPSAAYRVPD